MLQQWGNHFCIFLYVITPTVTYGNKLFQIISPLDNSVEQTERNGQLRKGGESSLLFLLHTLVKNYYIQNLHAHQTHNECQ